MIASHHDQQEQLEDEELWSSIGTSFSVSITGSTVKVIVSKQVSK